uniref:Tax1-binding protein 3 n=1 Tax=Eptatretus burgeri TaxID=7764 RepID=A0A8C4NFY9_EPTBU
MALWIPGQPVTAVVERIEICKWRRGDDVILGFSIGGGIDQDPSQNPYSEDKNDKGVFVTKVALNGPADRAGLRVGDKIMQVCISILFEKCYCLTQNRRLISSPSHTNEWGNLSDPKPKSPK